MFLFVHGETEWNAAKRFQGRHDSPLTPQGIEQAEAVGAILRVHVPEPRTLRFVSSPLGRALTSARIAAAELGIRPTAIATDDRLVEIDVGIWSGLTRKEALATEPERLGALSRHEWVYASPDGEGFDGVARRAADFLADHKQHDDLAVATHGITSRLLRGLHAGLPREALISAPIERGVVFHLSGGKIRQLGRPLS